MSELDRIEREVLGTREAVRHLTCTVGGVSTVQLKVLEVVSSVVLIQEEILQTQKAILELLGEPKSYPASSGGSIAVK